jgi:hypothetical protein
LLSVDELWGDEFGLALSYSDFPACSVDDGVVVAGHDAVSDGGVAAVLPFCAMVHIAERGRAVTPRVGAPVIADGDRAADGGGDGAGGPSDVQWFAGGGEQDGDDSALAGEHAELGW